ncbi:MAG: DEAD/DEAH box helicase family protein, partial [Selenomonadaceae bacterium]|nr:DEAD/DEAH box helicase family protein [Selenomonadaceae bacterium]
MYLKNYQNQALAKLSAFLTEAKLLGDCGKAFKNQREAPGYPADYVPLQKLEDVPYVCLRLPTGGGKTLLASHAIPLTARNFWEKDYPFVLWLVPTDMIRKQTHAVLSNLKSPNRKALDSAFGGRVRVYDVSEFTRLRPQDVTGEVNLFVATFASFRVKSKEGRKVYAHHELLEPCFRDIPKQDYFDEDKNGYASFRNLL